MLICRPWLLPVGYLISCSPSVVSFRTSGLSGLSATQLPLSTRWIFFFFSFLELLQLQSRLPHSKSPKPPFFLPRLMLAFNSSTLPCNNTPACLNALSCYRVIGRLAICANEAGNAGLGLLKSQQSGCISRLPVISLISCISPLLFLITPSSDHVQSLWKAPRGASNRRLPLSRRSVISLIPPPTVLMCQTFTPFEGRNLCSSQAWFFFFFLFSFRRRHFSPDTKPRWERKKLLASLRLQPTKSFSRDLSDYSPRLPSPLSYITLL